MAQIEDGNARPAARVNGRRRLTAWSLPVGGSRGRDEGEREGAQARDGEWENGAGASQVSEQEAR